VSAHCLLLMHLVMRTNAFAVNQKERSVLLLQVKISCEMFAVEMIVCVPKHIITLLMLDHNV
jgi:hypothetical protein